MPNLAKTLNDEIRRLARREIRAAIAKLQEDNKRLKQAAADHKKRIAQIEKENRRLLAQRQKARKAESVPDSEQSGRVRITGKTIRNIRARLGLSQAGFARLVGVSSQSVYQWERNQGRLTFRGDTKAHVIEVRRLGMREAHRRLEEIE